MQDCIPLGPPSGNEFPYGALPTRGNWKTGKIPCMPSVEFRRYLFQLKRTERYKRYNDKLQEILSCKDNCGFLYEKKGKVLKSVGEKEHVSYFDYSYNKIPMPFK